MNILEELTSRDFSRGGRLAAIGRSRTERLSMAQVLTSLEIDTTQLLANIALPAKCRQGKEADLQNAALFKIRINVPRLRAKDLLTTSPNTAIPHVWLEAIDVSLPPSQSAKRAVVFPNDDDRNQRRLMLLVERHKGRESNNTLEIIATNINQNKASGLYIMEHECAFTRWMKGCVGQCPDALRCQFYEGTRTNRDSSKFYGSCNP